MKGLLRPLLLTVAAFGLMAYAFHDPASAPAGFWLGLMMGFAYSAWGRVE